PLISVFSIVLIIAIIVALNEPRLGSIGLILISAVALHNASGLLVGYWLPRVLGLDKRTCKTLAIEVGMQNSGLAVALAVKYFSPAAALPGALFSLWHNLTGSLLAAVWSRSK
ncbi:MAG: BASS family bile acid:Na+ symporter, partial [Cycloclasticus sp.]